MTTDEPFALHITWTCYGTWLPGDARGYVSNTLLPGGGFLPKENTPGTPYSADEEYTRNRARALQKGPTVFLTADQAMIVANALINAAQSRGWRIVRGAVMSNHVHVVVMDCPDDGEVVRRILKGNSQAALSEDAGRSQRWWTAGGSDRYKHGSEAVEAAVAYVADQPGMLAEIVNMQAQPARARLVPPTEEPAMTLTRANVLRLLSRYGALGYELTLLEVHKLLYFLQLAGEGLQLRFAKETHGPFADNLRHTLQQFEGRFTVGFGDGRNSPESPFQVLPRALKAAEEYITGHQQEDAEAEQRFERVTQLIEGFESPYGMELLASVHWVATHPEEQATDLDSTIRAIQGWSERKRRIMKPEHIRIAWERLWEKGWI